MAIVTNMVKKKGTATAIIMRMGRRVTVMAKTPIITAKTGTIITTRIAIWHPCRPLSTRRI